MSKTNSAWSVERQVRLIVGILVLTGLGLSYFVSPYWLILSGFVGLGLIVAGFTDVCPMVFFVAKCPWNRAQANAPIQTAR